MRRIAFVVGSAAFLAFGQGAWGQDSAPPKPAPQTQIHPQMPPAPKKPKTQATAPADVPSDPVQAADQREEERLNEKLKSICRGC
jgi:hypothetical protein